MIGSKTGKASLQQEQRFHDLWAIGCIACRIDHGRWVAPEMDHRNVGDLAGMPRTKGGHSDTLPLCCWHHRGIPWDGWASNQMERLAGPSKHLSKRKFFDKYGRIDRLYEILQEALDGKASWQA